MGGERVSGLLHAAYFLKISLSAPPHPTSRSESTRSYSMHDDEPHRTHRSRLHVELEDEDAAVRRSVDMSLSNE
eukprot:COSAG01_NODE_8003_length_2957_cov_2.178796_1_plen_74_part_00